MEKIVSALKLSKEVNHDLIVHFENLLLNCYTIRDSNDFKGLD